jgi:hypothetical protein
MPAGQPSHAPDECKAEQDIQTATRTGRTRRRERNTTARRQYRCFFNIIGLAQALLMAASVRRR